MTKSIYEKAVEDSFQKLKSSLQDDFSQDGFPWDLLIEMLIVENSPLTQVFSVQTTQLAELYHTAKHLSTIADDLENHDNDEIDESVREKIVEADIDASKDDVYADFEDIGG